MGKEWDFSDTIKPQEFVKSRLEYLKSNSKEFSKNQREKFDRVFNEYMWNITTLAEEFGVDVDETLLQCLLQYITQTMDFFYDSLEEAQQCNYNTLIFMRLLTHEIVSEAGSIYMEKLEKIDEELHSCKETGCNQIARDKLLHAEDWIYNKLKHIYKAQETIMAEKEEEIIFCKEKIMAQCFETISIMIGKSFICLE